MLHITPEIYLNSNEIYLTFIASPGPGGQNVNKVASAVLLRFNVAASPSLPESARRRLVHVLAHRLTQKGELIIKASRFRTQEQNKRDAIQRLTELLRKSVIPPKPRKKTKPTRGSIEKRLNRKKKVGERKSLRGKVAGHE